MRSFVYLKLRADPKAQEIVTTLNELRRLGYRAVVVDIPPEMWSPEVRDEVRALSLHNLRVYASVEVDAESDPDWRSTLARVRPIPDYLSVKVARLADARAASLIKSVDSVVLSPSCEEVFWDLVSAREAARTRKVVEVPLSPILNQLGSLRLDYRRIRRMKIMLRVSKRAGLPIVASDPSLGRPIQPSLAASALTSLLSVGWEESLDSLSAHPSAILSGERRLFLRGYDQVED